MRIFGARNVVRLDRVEHPLERLPMLDLRLTK